ncbi:MAG: zinc ribbon domain-containing protein [Candidatus Coatesbacteria bacterium]|nr:MAG: zinc ribbon domain-containing protein [Candidatus Coatesbacteria bacterium]
MPIYEFRCEKCGAEFERLRRPEEEEPVTCPACRAQDCRKLISRFATSSSPDPSAGAACNIKTG